MENKGWTERQGKRKEQWELKKTSCNDTETELQHATVETGGLN